MNRRNFLKKSAGAGAAGLMIQSGLLSNPSKNETLQVALIGSGRMGNGNMDQALALGVKSHNVRVVALCDVDSKRVEYTKGRVNQFYKEQGEQAVSIATYEDYRDLLKSDKIDAVIVATPDNWHGLQGVDAARAGKHIYMQKPLTYGISEGQALIDAVRKNGVILQTGSQQRSSVYFRQVVNIVRNNWLGALKEIQVEVPTDKGTMEDIPMEVPANLNYDLWLGPCPEAPYTEGRVHPHEMVDGKYWGRPGWLQVERYCRGMITGWGTHMYDIAQWAMGTDKDSGPIEYTSTGIFPKRGLWDVHTAYYGEAFYENGVKMISRNGEPGVRFIMENGWAYCARGKFDCSDRQLLRRQPKGNEVSVYYSEDHMADFFEAIRENRDPACPVEVGHRSNTICVLHHLSMKLGGRKIHWDPKRELPINDNDVEAMLDIPMRKPWRIS